MSVFQAQGAEGVPLQVPPRQADRGHRPCSRQVCDHLPRPRPLGSQRPRYRCNITKSRIIHLGVESGTPPFHIVSPSVPPSQPQPQPGLDHEDSCSLPEAPAPSRNTSYSSLCNLDLHSPLTGTRQVRGSLTRLQVFPISSPTLNTEQQICKSDHLTLSLAVFRAPFPTSRTWA